MSSFPRPADHGPMDPEKYRELVDLKQREIGDAPPPLIEVEPYRVPAETSDLAAELLDEAFTRRLTGGELIILFEEASLHDLGRIAHQLRIQRSDPGTVTYIIDRNVTYTNLCYADCGFCAFNRHQGDGDDYLLSLDEILEKCRTVDAAGGNQILLQGGIIPKSGSTITRICCAASRKTGRPSGSTDFHPARSSTSLV